MIKVVNNNGRRVNSATAIVIVVTLLGVARFSWAEEQADRSPQTDS